MDRMANPAEPPDVPPQSIPAAEAGWSLHADAARYDIAVRAAGVLCRCADPTRSNAADLAPMGERTDPLVTLRGSDQAIAWRLAAWHQPDTSTLHLTLHGDAAPIEAEIAFTLDAPTGMLHRRATLRHHGDGPPFDLGATLAFSVSVPEPIDDLLHLTGDWAQEAQVQHQNRFDQPLLLESRTGKSGFRHEPYVALRASAATYVCQLFWSGNWAIEVRPGPDGIVLQGGFNPWRFRHRLRTGNDLTLPETVFGRVAGDLNAATQRLHAWRRAHRLAPARPIPVQFNSWYSHYEELSTEAMLRMIPLVRDLGCEGFVIDSGWFAADDADAAPSRDLLTGDWRVSPSRFPNGLREVSDACEAAGLGFGLWFEPEAIGPFSAVRAKNPEWLHHIDDEPPAGDKRALLHLGVPDAWQHAYDRVTQVLRQVGAVWMKWDFNTDLGSGGWAPGLPPALTYTDPLVAHYLGLYRLQDAIRAAFPDLVLEMCASGGGRLDGAILSHAHVNWISDQPAPLRKLAIHFGTQLMHPPEACNDMLIQWPQTFMPGYGAEPSPLDDRCDLAFRLRVAMLGAFGLSCRLDHWSEGDRAVGAAHVAFYRERLRPIIPSAVQFMLTDAPPVDGAGDWAAVWYLASRDEAGAPHREAGALFVFRLAGDEPVRRFALPGLLAERQYRLSWQDSGTTLHDGAALLAGLQVRIDAPFRSALCVVQAV
jgi:alpha-galactosidase